MVKNEVVESDPIQEFKDAAKTTIVQLNTDILDFKSGLMLVQEKPFTTEGVSEIKKQTSVLERTANLVGKVVNGECDEKLAIETLAKKIDVVNLQTDELKTWVTWMMSRLEDYFNDGQKTNRCREDDVVLLSFANDAVTSMIVSVRAVFQSQNEYFSVD